MNMAQLQANNAALTAALASREAAIKAIKDQGFTGSTSPNFPLWRPRAERPREAMSGSTLGRIWRDDMNETARYQRVFGAAVPEDPANIPTGL